MKLIANLKNLRFIDEIHQIWKFSSTRVATVGLVFTAAAPLLQVWSMIPDTMKLFMPDTIQACVPLLIIFAAILIARATTTKPKFEPEQEAGLGSPNA